jgi:hypothetical protein
MANDELFDALSTVNDEASFIQFAELLTADRKLSESSPVTPDGFQGGWANQTIADFLRAASAWATDSGFGVRPGPNGPALNCWSARKHTRVLATSWPPLVADCR